MTDRPKGSRLIRALSVSDGSEDQRSVHKDPALALGARM